MRITLLPSQVSSRGVERGQFLTSYLIDDTVAIDAGALGLLGDLEAQARVRRVFLSHSHADHIASLPVFLDNILSAGTAVTLHAGEATLDCLRRDVFNDRLWPDFLRLSAEGRPFVTTAVLEPGKPVEVEGLRITPVEVNHVVPTLAFLVEAVGAAVVFSSDTGPTEALWRLANAAEHLKAVFLEASFPDEYEEVAKAARHLTPSLFAAEARKLTRPATFIAVHLKPIFQERIARELFALGLADLKIGLPGESYRF